MDLLVRDTDSGATGVQHVGFKVPSFPKDKLASSGIVLAAKLEALAGDAGGRQFMIGTTKVIPNLSGEYHRGQPVGIYLQVYNAAVDQTTLRPAVDVEYVLLRDDKEIAKEIEDWQQLNDAGQRLTLTRLIDTKDLAYGEYRLAVRIRDRITGDTIMPTAGFKVIP